LRSTKPRSTIKLLLAAIICLMAITLPCQSWASTEGRIRDCARAVREMSRERDSDTMRDLLRSSHGVAIFPSVVKAGLGIGGKYGEGILLRHDPHTDRWYGPSFVNVAGLSWGLQIGVQSTALVLVINNRPGIEAFEGDKITLGADVAVAAGPVGRRAEAGTDSSLKASIYSYSMSKGLFAGLSLEGAVISTEHDTNRAYWGRKMSVQEILSHRASGSKMAPLLKVLREVSRPR
jgi:lipid-binding SYLF domain-containing protein